jgi:hypothetical protein
MGATRSPFADTGSGRYPPAWSPAQGYGATLDAAAALAPPTSFPVHIPAVAGTVLGKRSRGAEDDGVLYANDGHQPRPSQKGKGKMADHGVLEAAGSPSRARHKPVTRTPVEKIDKSKTAGRGAERLAATTAHEVYHHFLPGPSFQQALVGATAPVELAWVEGSVEGGAWHLHRSVVQEEVAEPSHSTEHDEQAGGNVFQIPRGSKERYRALLAATPADWDRRAVDVLKCRLYPAARLQ